MAYDMSRPGDIKVHCWGWYGAIEIRYMVYVSPSSSQHSWLSLKEMLNSTAHHRVYHVETNTELATNLPKRAVRTNMSDLHMGSSIVCLLFGLIEELTVYLNLGLLRSPLDIYTLKL